MIDEVRVVKERGVDSATNLASLFSFLFSLFHLPFSEEWKSEIAEWLDSSNTPVLYVALGSKVVVPRDLLHELMQGLKLASEKLVFPLSPSLISSYPISSFLPLALSVSILSSLSLSLLYLLVPRSRH